MTNEQANRVANALIAAAAVGVTVVVMRSPTLRRLAWRLAVTAVTGALPAWIGREVRLGWVESGQRGI
jgi:uncharacterized protein (DUF2236 family)